MKKFFARFFSRPKGGVIDPPFVPAPEPQIVKHVTTVEVKFTDLEPVVLYVVIKPGRGQTPLVHGYSDRVNDVKPFVSDPAYKVTLRCGYRLRSGGGFNNLFLVNSAEAAPRLPMRVD